MIQLTLNCASAEHAAAVLAAFAGKPVLPAVYEPTITVEPPAAAEPAPAAAPMVVPWDEPTPPGKPAFPGFEETRARLAAIGKAGKRDEVKALLARYGATTLSEVPAEQRAALIADAEAL